MTRLKTLALAALVSAFALPAFAAVLAGLDGIKKAAGTDG